MSTIVRNFLPDVSMEIEDLRKVVSKIRGQSHHDSAVGSRSRLEDQEQQQRTPQSIQAPVAEPPSSHADSTALGEAPPDDRTRNSNNQAAAQGPYRVDLFHIPASSPETQGGPNRDHPVHAGQLLSPLLTIAPLAEPVSEQERLVPDARDIHR